jgi:acetylornithine deacetylase/succinyl-diaminopimelate desuccinylase-like protein
VDGWRERLADELIGIAAIGAQTWHERRRGAHLVERWRAVGIDDAHLDPVGNVVGRMRGTAAGPCVLLCANMDTVFPDTDPVITREGNTLRGPGAWMNASAIAVILGAVAALREARVDLPGDLVVAATVCEEAGGGFRGMRQLVADWGDSIDAVLFCGNVPGTAHHRTLGRVAHHIEVRTPGGHAYGNHGIPSAVHVLLEICQRYLAIPIPPEPRTSRNVGVISGGMSVNSIAARAEADVETRSPDAAVMTKLERELQTLVEDSNQRESVSATLTEVDRSPSGEIPDDHPLVQLVYESHRALGLQIFSQPANTDADICLAAGIPSVVHGTAVGGMPKSASEYTELDSLPVGVKSLLMSIALVMERYPLRRAIEEKERDRRDTDS